MAYDESSEFGYVGKGPLPKPNIDELVDAKEEAVNNTPNWQDGAPLKKQIWLGVIVAISVAALAIVAVKNGWFK